ncbi:hypothetical protein OG203_02260 [Nocardia sp. NBC_01499]|uniref:hypothetical protein n=1 Tax=Nocardia sp. NBC_01499 TaxID=2903597 RepID=UPI00386D0AC4
MDALAGARPCRGEGAVIEDKRRSSGRMLWRNAIVVFVRIELMARLSRIASEVG